MASRHEQAAARDHRISVIKAFIRRNVDREVTDFEMASIERLSNQTLHLLVSALAEAKHGE